MAGPRRAEAGSPGRGGVGSALALGAVLLLLVPTISFAEEVVFKTEGMGIVSIDRLVEDLGKARMVVVGEHHNDYRHHRAQLMIIRRLVDSGAKVALGLEMFRKDAQQQLDRWVGGDLSDRDFMRLFGEHWNIAFWSVYSPIFRYAKEKALPLVGLNVPRTIIRQVSREGFDSLDEEQRAALGGVACRVDKKYERALRNAFGGDLHQEVFQNFCEAQVLWDTVMAKEAVDYLERNPDALMVVLCGSTHAWKFGLPAQVKNFSDLPVLTVMPSEDRSYLNYDILLEDADYVWWHLTPP